MVCFAKNTFNLKKIRLAGPKAQVQPDLNNFCFLYFLWAGSSPIIWAGPDPASPASSLVQPSDQAAAASTRELIHVFLHSK